MMSIPRLTAGRYITSASRVVSAVMSAVIVAAFFTLPVFAGNISSTNQYAWGENIGWLVWGSSQGNVTVGTTEVTGYVWGENVGWISLNCSNTSTCGTVNYKMSRSGTAISGFAWGENVGWISFNCSNTSTCGTVNYSTAYNETTGEFSGHAWGENVGWIVMNCSTTSTCGVVDYKVATSVVVTPTPGGGAVLPPAAPSPAATPTPTASPAASPTPIVIPSPTTVPIVPPPPAPPPGAVPAGPPAPAPGIPGLLNQIGLRIDQAASGLGQFIDRFAGQPVESGAGAATAVALAPILWAAVQVVQTKSAGAALYSFLQIVGLKKRPRLWGTVYDSSTKHPIAFARVQILGETNRVLETRFADRDGRYGFLLSSSVLRQEVRKVRLVATRQGYAFPSRNVRPGTDYIVFERPYLGEVVEVVGGTALTYDIPMDPVLAVGMPARPPFAAVISRSWETVLNIGFYAGLVLVPWNMIMHPTTGNFIVGAVFFGANAFRVLKMYRPYGHVKDVVAGGTVPFSLVTLHDAAGQRLSFSVSDEEGRYFLSTHGEQDYQVRVHTPANMTPPRTTTEDIGRGSKEIRQGWITKEVKV